MKTKETFSVACLAAVLSCTVNSRYPPLTITEDGIEKTLYVQYPDWASSVSTSDNEFEYGFNNRMYLSESETLDTSSYYKPNLLGGVMEYDVDLSRVGCGCVSALYTVLMPGIDNGSDPFKYCDANQVGGHWCPEFDIMEANKHAFHATGHKCDEPNNGIYNNCDRGGQCTLDVWPAHSNAYGPGGSEIDTEQPFHVKTEFHEDTGVFIGYSQTLTQAGRSIAMATGDCR